MYSPIYLHLRKSKFMNFETCLHIKYYWHIINHTIYLFFLKKGWKGDYCDVPICAQECNNDGACGKSLILIFVPGLMLFLQLVAPDTCQCKIWENTWRDGRIGAGHPIFKQPNGDPQFTGWTGYDCR